MLDKAIQHGREHRKPYRGPKAIDRTCCNNGTCEWCRSNRLYSSNKKIEKANLQLKEYAYLMSIQGE